MNTATKNTSYKRAGMYSIVIALSAIAGFTYATRTAGLLACQAPQPGSDQYVGICDVSNFGDYDHGAFWFNLEPSAVESARKAKVLFVGNSRTQFALSSPAVDDWFDSRSIKYYLLGFSHNENHRFVGPLLEKLRPQAKAYVVNVDLFFEDDLSGPANSVMNETGSRNRYKQKFYWQGLHNVICGSFPALCGNASSYIRQRENGAWLFRGDDFLARRDFSNQSILYDWNIDEKTLINYDIRAAAFIESLRAEPGCVFLTNIPNSDTSIGTAHALAERLALPLIAPETTGLTTFDGSHLSPDSASRWSAPFMNELTPQIEKCLDQESR